MSRDPHEIECESAAMAVLHERAEARKRGKSGMTATEVRSMLKRACTAAGTARAWAKAHGVSEAYVSDVLNSRRDPGEAICKALGLVSEQTYRKVPK